ATTDAGAEEIPALEEALEGKSKQTRAEKKMRKALSKFGLKPVSGVYRVTVKNPQSVMFVITNPDVFKAPDSETYVIYGEAKMEDSALNRFQDAAKNLNLPTTGGADDEVPALEDATVDATGVEETDINLVVSQTGASRDAAVAALKKHNGDIVNSIMELTNIVQTPTTI
ncbi:MAG: hypothetical protein Q8P67_17565, partial [archaeon]|nr:hypothetical protein [archaeon]